jgi:hypothetical protein
MKKLLVGALSAIAIASIATAASAQQATLESITKDFQFLNSRPTGNVYIDPKVEHQGPRPQVMSMIKLNTPTNEGIKTGVWAEEVDCSQGLIRSLYVAAFNIDGLKLAEQSSPGEWERVGAESFQSDVAQYACNH